MSEQPVPSKEEIAREAIALEVFFDNAPGDLWLRKGDLFCYCTQDNAQGRVLAMEWLAQMRRSMEARDALRSLEFIPRRRLHTRWLWGRETRVTHADTLTSETRPTTSVDGLEVEVFATEYEAVSAFATVPSFVEQQAAACVAANRNREGIVMAHTFHHRPANRTRRSKREIRRLHLWITLHARLCECCGLPLVGRSYTNAAWQAVCRGCFLTGLPAQAADASEMPQRAQEGERC